MSTPLWSASAQGDSDETTWEIHIHSPMNEGYIGEHLAIVSADFASDERQLVAIEVRIDEGLWEGGTVEGSTESVRSHYGATITHGQLVGDHTLDIRHHLDDGTTFIESLVVKVGTSESAPVVRGQSELLDDDDSAIFMASHPEGIKDVVGRWFIRGTPMEISHLPLTWINGTDGITSRTVEARYLHDLPEGCPCTFMVEATSNNGHIARFLSDDMTSQWSMIPQMVDSSPGWLEPREGTVLDSWQSIEPILELAGWSLFVDHLDIRPTVLNRCDVVPENASATRVRTIEILDSYTDGPLLIRLASTDEPTLWNECRIIFLDRNTPTGSMTTQNQSVLASGAGVMVNLSVQDIGYDLVQDGTIIWTHSLLNGSESQPFEILDQGESIRINTSVPGQHLVRVTVEDIAGHTLRIELIIEVLSIEPLATIQIDGKPHWLNNTLSVKNGTRLSIEFSHPIHRDSDYDVRWLLNGVVVATGQDVEVKTTWFNHLSDMLVVEAVHPEGITSISVNITDVTEEKGQMGEESEDTTGMRIFDLGLNHAIAILALLVGGAFTIRWLAGYRYRVPSWGKDPPSGQ